MLFVVHWPMNDPPGLGRRVEDPKSVLARIDLANRIQKAEPKDCRGLREDSERCQPPRRPESSLVVIRGPEAPHGPYPWRWQRAHAKALPDPAALMRALLPVTAALADALNVCPACAGACAEARKGRIKNPVVTGCLSQSQREPSSPLLSNLKRFEPREALAMNWSAEAEAKLKEIPFFVRPAVRKRIEAMASESGLSSIDLAFYEDAKARFGQK